MQVTTNRPVCLSWHCDGWIVGARITSGWGVTGMCGVRVKTSSRKLPKNWNLSEIMKGDNQQDLLTVPGTDLCLWAARHNIFIYFMTSGGCFCWVDIKVGALREHFISALGYLCLYILSGTLAHNRLEVSCWFEQSYFTSCGAIVRLSYKRCKKKRRKKSAFILGTEH